ncbi:MAG: hypothetical protein ACK53T_10495 [Planctomycetota bacterium]
MRHLLSASSLLLATPLLAQQLPEVEPNDTAATAQVVALGAQVNCNLAAGEVDWFRFTTPGGYMRLATTSALDLQLELSDATGTTVQAFTDDGQGLNPSLWMNLAAGTYSIKIDGFSATVTGAYSMEISTAGSKPLTGNEVEPNDTIATATVATDGAQLGGSLRPAVQVLTDVAGATNTTTITQSTAALTAGAYADGRYWLRFTSGANSGQQRRISANTATDITVASAFAAAATAGDAFEVLEYDSDYYRVDVTAPRALVAFSVTDGDDTWVRGWSYEVRDAAGALITSATLGTNVADSNVFNPRVTSFRVWPTGTYYVRVFERRSDAVITNAAAAAAPANGNYRFELKVRDMNTAVVVENAEPNNTVATATPIAPGQQGQGNISISTGADASDLWGPITLTSQSLICFQTDAGAAPGLLDSTINLRQLLDPVAGTLGAPTAVTVGNALNTTAGNSHGRGIFNFFLPNTVYYLEVVSPGTNAATQSGNYVLEISVTDAPTYSVGQFAAVIANGAGCGTAGVPTIGRVIATELPILGQTFASRTSNLNGPANLGLLLIGTSGALGPSGAPAGSPQSIYNPQPLDLTLFGAPGCTLNVNPLLTELLVADPVTFTADYALPLPAAQAFAGVTLFLQPVKLDFLTPANALGVQPGNWLRLILGTRAF